MAVLSSVDSAIKYLRDQMQAALDQRVTSKQHADDVVTLTAGAGVTLDKVGQAVTISASGGGAASGVPEQFAPLVSALDAGRSVGIYTTGDSTGAGDQTGTDGSTAANDRYFTSFVRKLSQKYTGHHVMVRSWDAANNRLGPWVTMKSQAAGRAGYALNGRSMWIVPDQSAQLSTGVLDVQALIKPNAWTGTADPQTIAARVGAWNENGTDLLPWATAFSWRFEIGTDGKLKLSWSTAGAAWDEQWTSTAAITAAAGSQMWVRGVANVQAGASITVDFYTSTDGVSWTALGTSQSWSGSTVKAIFTPDARAWLEVGAFAASSYPLKGNVYELRVQDGRDGRPIAPFALHAWRRYGDTTTQPVGAPTLYLVNGSTSGSTHDEHVARGGRETPDYGTVLAIFNNGHNEGWLTGKGAWLDPYKAWIDDVLARLPRASACVVLQNPHTSAWPNEANYGREHITRLLELAAAAPRQGWAVADIYRAFYKTDPGLSSLVLSDGLHPTSAGYAVGGQVLASLAGA